MLIIISGSAGVGKNTVISELLKKHNDIKMFKTCTTRQPRSTDADMNNPYIYLTKEEFEKKIINNELFEFEEIHQNFYGTLKSSLDDISKCQNHYIKDIGVLGQESIKRALKNKAVVLSIFLTAPKDILIERLKARGDKDIELRMSRMEFENSFKSNYDFVIENINLDKTIEEVEKYIEMFKIKEFQQKK